MAHFDIVIAAGKAYQTSWQERTYLGRLAMPVIFLKLVCYVTAFALGYQGNYLLLTLILLPALFVEGWLLAHYVRLIFLGHRWPFRPSGNLDEDLPLLRIRARGVMGGILVYVLTHMAMGLIAALAFAYLPGEGEDATALPPAIGFLFMLFLVFSFWGFRLLWLYIPYAVNLDAKLYLQKLRGLFVSFPLIGIWLICSLPFFLLAQIFGGVAGQVFQSAGQDSIAMFVFLAVMVVADTLKNIVATAGIAYGLGEVFTADKIKGA